MKALSADGVSFAIPIDTAKHVVSQAGLLATRMQQCLLVLFAPPYQAESCHSFPHYACQ